MNFQPYQRLPLRIYSCNQLTSSSSLLYFESTRGYSEKMIPLVFKRMDYTDPDVQIGYKKIYVAFLRFSGMYPNLTGRWYYFFGVFGMYLHVFYFGYIIDYCVSVALAIEYSDTYVLVYNLCFGSLTVIYYVVLHYGMYQKFLLDEILKIVGQGFFTYERPPTPHEQKIGLSTDVACRRTFLRQMSVIVLTMFGSLILLPLSYGIRGEYSSMGEDKIPINKHLSLPMWLPYNTDTPLKFWLTLLGMFNDGSAEGRIIASSCIIYCNLCTCLASQFDLLSHSLRDLEARAIYAYERKGYAALPSKDAYYDDPRFHVIMNECLDENIRHYQVLLVFNSKLQKYVGPAVFAILSGMALTISCPSFLLLQLTKSEEAISAMAIVRIVNLGIIIGSFMTYLYFYCSYGQLVTSASEKLHFALYESPWMRANTSFKRKLIITMNRSEQPLRIDVLGLVKADSATFLDALKTMFSYCNLLAAVQN
ncbi:7tm Odorant receptor [Nesidiocoris tenuis]|uniref:Odorant receptor n=1 Tax=Nesidiocoris tenuis TaxID=355587 RepID=A0ABN7ATS5_9HEMI|nr:7tm Odorant receptor [Nesidiocoris tenuis]